MQRSDAVLLGRDYSAREFSPQELDQYEKDFPNEAPVQALGRYAGYPDNPKCISHYPGAYKAHWNSGRPVFLFHQIGYTDMAGGYNAGRAHAQTILADAQSDRIGWNGESPFVACMDRYYVKKDYATLTREQLREYMKGFVSVVGYELSGFYGFYDSMAHCVEENWAKFRVQCGAREHHVAGISAWQENNYQPKILGTQTDILEFYTNPFGGKKMTWEQFLEFIERWYRFHSRVKGYRASYEDGPTLPEWMGMMQAKLDATYNELSDDEAKIIAEFRQQSGSLTPEQQAELIKSRIDQSVWLAIQRLARASDALDENVVPPQQ